MLKHNFLSTLAGLILLMFTFGCSPDYVKPGVFVEVHGDVYLDKAPVREAKVWFVPEQRGLNEEFAISIATTNAKGEFQLATSDGREGALTGKHRVYISRIDEDLPSVQLEESPVTVADKVDEDEFDEAREREHVWQLIDRTVQQPPGETIPFYYNVRSEFSCDVIPGRGIQRVKFELSSVDPMLKSK